MSSTDPTPEPSPDEEARLRGLLRDAVPEAPDVAPPRRRRRGPRPALVVLAAAAAVAAIVVVPIVVTGDEQAQEAGSGPDPAGVALPADPWTADPCPERTSPPARRTTGVVPDLASATTIRLCALDTPPGDDALLTDFLVPDDALLTGFDDLQAAVDELPTARDTCASIDYFDGFRTSLVVTTPAGPEVLAADLCTELVVRDGDGSERRVVAGAVADAVVDALGEQRSAAEYPPFRFTLFDTQVPTFCAAPPTLAPVSPRESGLAVAVVCPDYNVGGSPRPLETGSDGLENLDRAWRRAPAPAVDDAFDGYDDEQASVVALTSQGDLVRMVPREGVDGLTLVVPRQSLGWGPTSEVPITLDDLVGR